MPFARMLYGPNHAAKDNVKGISPPLAKEYEGLLGEALRAETEAVKRTDLLPAF